MLTIYERKIYGLFMLISPGQNPARRSGIFQPLVKHRIGTKYFMKHSNRFTCEQ